MKLIIFFSIFFISLFKSDCQNPSWIGDYKVEFYNHYDQNYIITFRENDYFKVNPKGETIGKGEITKYLRDNGEGIIHLNDYIIYIPAKKNSLVRKSLKSDYTKFWFNNKDTIQFSDHHEGDDPHFCFRSGKMIKIKK